MSRENKSRRRKVKKISSVTLPSYDCDMECRMKFFPRKKTIIPKFCSKIVETNIDLNHKDSKFAIFIKKDVEQKGIIVKSGTFIQPNFRGLITVKIVNTNNYDVTLSMHVHLGYLIFTPYC